MTTTDTIKALRDALEQIKAGLSEKGPRVIAAEVLALTADASEDAPRQITYCEEEWITKTDWVQKDFQKDLFPLAYHGQHRADIMRDEIARLRRVIAHSAPVAATPAPDDPMDWPLPCDVKIGAGTIRKGCKLRTLVLRATGLHRMLMEATPQPTPEQRAAFDALIGRAAAPAAPIVATLDLKTLVKAAADTLIAEFAAEPDADPNEAAHNESFQAGKLAGVHYLKRAILNAEHAKPEPVKFCECTQQQRARCDFCAGFGQQAGAVDGEASCR